MSEPSNAGNEREVIDTDSVRGPYFQPTPTPTWFERMLDDHQVAELFSAEAELAALLRFEASLAEAEATEGVIPQEAAEQIITVCENFTADYTELANAALTDGVVVPSLVRQLREAVGGKAQEYVHLGATSQDAIDTSLSLRLAPLSDLLASRLLGLIDKLSELARLHGTHPMMGRTRMQAALPITVADRLSSWKTPLVTHHQVLLEMKPRLLRLQLGGPVGTLQSLGSSKKAIGERMATSLGLHSPFPCWHNTRDGIVEFADWLSRVSGSLGKFGQDVALMAQNGVDAVVLSGSGASSSMAHKKNPIKAEILVAMARYNACMISGMHHALVHEQERSGAAWVLEGLVLPRLIQCAGSAMVTANVLLDSIEYMGDQS